MHSPVGRAVRWSLVVSVAFAGALLTLPTTAAAQGSGAISGRVTDSTRNGIAASLNIVGSLRLGVSASQDGFYTLQGVPAGAARVVARFLGFRSDTFSVTVTAGATVTHDVVMHPVSTALEPVTVQSPRMNETTAGALQEQQTADNIIGDVRRRDPVASERERRRSTGTDARRHSRTR